VTNTTVIDPAADEAAARLAAALSPAAIDRLVADATTAGTPMDGVDGLLNRISKAVLERVLETEMTDISVTRRATRPAGAAAIPETVRPPKP
jgi:putative transposase